MKNEKIYELAEKYGFELSFVEKIEEKFGYSVMLYVVYSKSCGDQKFLETFSHSDWYFIYREAPDGSDLKKRAFEESSNIANIAGEYGSTYSDTLWLLFKRVPANSVEEEIVVNNMLLVNKPCCQTWVQIYDKAVEKGSRSQEIFFQKLSKEKQLQSLAIFADFIAELQAKSLEEIYMSYKREEDSEVKQLILKSIKFHQEKDISNWHYYLYDRCSADEALKSAVTEKVKELVSQS